MSAISTIPEGSGLPVKQAAKSAAISTDFNTFLKMLTVQMRNQDPTNPIESTDYAVQLATFSGVEQQVRTNELLAQLSKASSTEIAGLSAWIGAEVRSEAAFKFDGGTHKLFVEPFDGASSARLVVKDTTGAVVSSLDVPVNAREFTWQGKSADGVELPYGTYQLQVSYLDGDKTIGSRPVSAFQRVAEVRITGEGPLLVLSSGQSVSPEDVLALKERS